MSEQKKPFVIIFAYPDKDVAGSSLEEYAKRLRSLCPEMEIISLSRASDIPTALKQCQANGQKVMGIISHNTQFEDNIKALSVQEFLEKDPEKSALMSSVGFTPNSPPPFIILSGGDHIRYGFHPGQLFAGKGYLIGVLENWRREIAALSPSTTIPQNTGRNIS